MDDIKCYLFPVYNYQGQIINMHSFALISAYSYQLCLTCYLVKFYFRFFVEVEFIFTPSLASSLYIMVVYFITGYHREGFKMIKLCADELSNTEKLQIFNQLECLGTTFILMLVLAT